MIFPAGSILMTEGDFATSMFAIVEGTVSVAVADRDGADRHVAELKRGDVVGEMSLMTGARRSATVTATTEVVALEVTKFSLEAILTRAPELIDRFGEILARRQAELDQTRGRGGAEGRHRQPDPPVLSVRVRPPRLKTICKVPVCATPRLASCRASAEKAPELQA